MASFQHSQKSRGDTLVRSSTVNGNMTLLDLPVEIVLDIVGWLRRSGTKENRKSRHNTSFQSFKALRLTSRSLAGILAPVLLDAVNISCITSARDFLEWCAECADHNREPPVRRLTIRNVGHPSSPSDNPQLVPYHLLEDILLAIAPSLHQLKIHFYDCFEFTDKITHSFRRAKKLWALHLEVNPHLPHSNPVPLTSPYPFLSSLKALTSLSELNLNNCLDHCMPLETRYPFTPLPCVQHLSVRIDSSSTSSPSEPHKFLLELCRAISNSLLILEIKGSRYDSSKLLPVLSVTRRRLEALSLSDAGLVQKCNRLKFPRLRTLFLDDSRYLTREEFYSPFFEQLNTIVLRRWCGTDVPLDIPVEAIPNLNRVILTYTAHLTPDTIPLFKACQDSGIELLASAKSVDLREIWTVDTLEAQVEETPY
ncbi:hypothetical protein MJO28_003165 [Puccinia striiformis f. sp. tritici]|uniref:F-box domain-containing protein n=4 Tax=Puccinia striiformis TaxID=27350 RepID=A0A0L0VHB0_9BASI|nr:hypothetical protein MJO28_003165 [Puccinia striiformis f. sp. tritici]KNE98665.1 hypothetical protein PSTG_08035 [Puccinia striiformis f. sp. tritici PST-78]POW21657.1 hypothetical protein PSHT_02201 [Puccinia striiformis]